ncbi:MAG: hypothetical protein ACRC92_18795 [Peptostreptococcaceae bacterium]
MAVLECSSKGDKRFSALYAKIKVNGVYDSIENHYQKAKLFKDGHGFIRKGAKPIGIHFNGVDYKDTSLLSSYYAMLWFKYLFTNKDLLEVINSYDDFTDTFRGKSVNCQADMIKDVREYGLQGFFILRCRKFVRGLLGNKAVQDYIEALDGFRV